MIVISLILSVIFFFLGIIHFNWAIGGKFGFENSLPTTENGKKVLNPKKLDSAIVGFFLIAFSFHYIIKSGLLIFTLPNWMQNHLGWIISSLFLLRSIGDFKYVGFFKRIKNTSFGKIDSRFYSPLCLLIALLGSVVFYLE